MKDKSKGSVKKVAVKKKVIKKSSAKKTVKGGRKSLIDWVNATYDRKIKKEKAEAERTAERNSYGVLMSSIEAQSAKVRILKEKCLFLYGTKMPFTLTKTGGSYKLDSPIFKVRAFRGGFSVSDVNFIKKVKRYVIKNDIADKFIDYDYQSKKIDYIKVKEYSDGEVINGVTEIDVNHAYWETAYLMGVIDKSIYKQGEKVDKRVRLACLGALAKRLETWEFDGKDFKKKKDVRSWATENIWFAICKRVADAMNECVKVAGDAFVFYWVDGLYIKSGSGKFEAISDCFADWGYSVKSKYYREIVFHKDKFVVSGVVAEDVREFSYSPKHSKKIGTIADYNEDLRLKELASEIFGGAGKGLLEDNFDVETI